MKINFNIIALVSILVTGSISFTACDKQKTLTKDGSVLNERSSEISDTTNSGSVKKSSVSVQKNVKLNEKENDLTEELYEQKLEELMNSDFGQEVGEIEKMQYALLDISGDDKPELLVSGITNYGISHVRIFQGNPKTKEINEFANEIEFGVSNAGGFRGGLQYDKENHALEETSWLGGTGEAERHVIKLQDDKIISQKTWEGFFDDIPKTQTEEINWIDVEGFIPERFRSGLDEKEYTDLEKLKSQGKNVVSGTFKRLSGKEIVEIEKVEVPSGLFDEMIRDVFVFDEPVEITWRFPNYRYVHYGENTLNIIRFEEGLITDDLLNKHATIMFDKDNALFPSDFNIPVNAPRIVEFEILEWWLFVAINILKRRFALFALLGQFDIFRG